MNQQKIINDRIDHEAKGRKFHYKDSQESIAGHKVKGNSACVKALKIRRDLDGAMAGNRGF